MTQKRGLRCWHSGTPGENAAHGRRSPFLLYRNAGQKSMFSLFVCGSPYHHTKGGGVHTPMDHRADLYVLPHPKGGWQVRRHAAATPPPRPSGGWRPTRKPWRSQRGWLQTSSYLSWPGIVRPGNLPPEPSGSAKTRGRVLVGRAPVFYISLRPSSARISVASSAYSRWPPTGTP